MLVDDPSISPSSSSSSSSISSSSVSSSSVSSEPPATAPSSSPSPSEAFPPSSSRRKIWPSWCRRPCPRRRGATPSEPRRDRARPAWRRGPSRTHRRPRRRRRRARRRSPGRPARARPARLYRNRRRRRPPLPPPPPPPPLPRPRPPAFHFHALPPTRPSFHACARESVFLSSRRFSFAGIAPSGDRAAARSLPNGATSFRQQLIIRTAGGCGGNISRARDRVARRVHQSLAVRAEAHRPVRRCPWPVYSPRARVRHRRRRVHRPPRRSGSRRAGARRPSSPGSRGVSVHSRGGGPDP